MQLSNYAETPSCCEWSAPPLQPPQSHPQKTWRIIPFRWFVTMISFRPLRIGLVNLQMAWWKPPQLTTDPKWFSILQAGAQQTTTHRAHPSVQPSSPTNRVVGCGGQWTASRDLGSRGEIFRATNSTSHLKLTAIFAPENWMDSWKEDDISFISTRPIFRGFSCFFLGSVEVTCESTLQFFGNILVAANNQTSLVAKIFPRTNFT